MPATSLALFNQDGEPWDLQEGESAKDHKLLQHFIAQGPRRTLTATAETAKKPLSTIRALAKKRDWVMRAEAFDAAQRQQFAITTEHDRQEVVGEATAVVKQALVALKKKFASLTDRQIEAMSTREAAMLLTSISQIQKSNWRDETPSVTVATQVTVGDEFRPLLPHERRAVEELKRQIAEGEIVDANE